MNSAFGRAILLSTATLLCVTIEPLSARCALARYTVSGTVVDPAGKPVPEATILLFPDDYEETWPRGYARPYSDFVKTDLAGTFRGEFYFETYGGGTLLGGDSCTRIPKLLTVVIVHEGHFAKRTVVDLKRKPPVSNGSGYAIALPAQTLSTPGPPPR